MRIGDAALFTRAHYEAHRGVAPPHLAELVVHCLELVALLARSGLPFRFKGGNSQLILLETPARFSIDVDIVTTVDKAELTRVVEGIVADSACFTRCEVRPHRTKPWLPILSFKVFFDSIYGHPIQGEPEPCVLLDAVLEPAPYGGVKKRVASGPLYDAPYEVELPTIGGLLADKMLCISPATVGIPLGKGKDAHRLKHVFDVANLSRHAPDPDEVHEALVACLAQENAIQKSQHTFDQVADDTIDFCEQVLAHEEAPPLESVDPTSYLFEIVRGYPDVGAFFFREEYGWATLRRDCAQVIAAVEAAR